MTRPNTRLWFALLLSVAAGATTFSALAADPRVLTLGAYTAPREAYREIIPLFIADWQRRSGERIKIRESYSGSGAQSRAIVDGFEADVAALAIGPDIQRLVGAGLVRPSHPASAPAIVSTSIVVLGVRSGNPKRITDWSDLVRPGLRIVMANPKTSGGAQWTILAVHGAVQRGAMPGYPADDAGTARYLGDLLTNLWVLEKGAREAIIAFEKGIGDVVITYENEMRLGQSLGQTYEIVYPSATLVTEHPVAVVNAYARKHGVEDLAQGFVEFLFSDSAQAVFARYGFRPPAGGGPMTADGGKGGEPFRIDAVGGWSSLGPMFFGSNGLYTRVFEQAMARR